MPSLTIREIPETLIKRMRQAAKAEGRSLNSQAIKWLEQAAQEWHEPSRNRDLFEAIQANRESIRQRQGLGSDSVELIQAMRHRGQDLKAASDHRD
jgi:plasmid stability protein